MIGKIWTAFFFLSLCFGALTERMPAVSQAAAAGAAQAVELIIGIAGTMVLWSGMMELVQRSGLGERLQKILRPLLKRLFGPLSGDKEAMELVSANVTANMLGVSNAATPIGLQAAKALRKAEGERSTNGVLTLIVLNTASIQLIPTTVAAVRTGLGCTTPYDILPAIWAASIASVVVVLGASRILQKVI
ncbi:MAG: spore maturation protein A [Butyricicoccus sp.]|nr:spore maturation protein A [Butyricicoccus sp.]